MSVPKNHHTTSRVYLENFIDEDGRLTVKSKRRSTVLRPKPGKALTRYHYYSQPLDGIENADQTIETVLFNQIETVYPNLYSSLIDPTSKVNITNLIQTLLSMCVRSPGFREAFEIGLADFVDAHRKSIPRSSFPPAPEGFEDIWDNVIVTIDPHRSIHAMHHYLNNYAQLLTHLEYQLYFAPNGTTLLTSDNPVIWFETRFGRNKPQIHSFIVTPKTRAVFPISKVAVLVGKKSPTGDFNFLRSPKTLSKRMLREINEMQLACAWDEVVGTAKLPTLSANRYSRFAPKFSISNYNPNTNQFDISVVELAEFKTKHKFTRK